MSNIFNELSRKGFNMLEAFADFHRVLNELQTNASEKTSAGARPIHGVELEDTGDGEYADQREPSGREDEEGGAYYCEDFPGRKFFRREDLDMDDPAWYTGKEIGIPIAVAVHSNPRQGKFIPVQSGRFNDEGY